MATYPRPVEALRPVPLPEQAHAPDAARAGGRAKTVSLASAGGWAFGVACCVVAHALGLPV